MYRHACGMGLEAIVSKRVESRYRSGRCRSWVKVKNPAYQRR
jgi:ATP-dependent DNA ligase